MTLPTLIIFFYLGFCSYTDIKKRIIYKHPTVIISASLLLICFFTTLKTDNAIHFFISFIPGIMLVGLSFITNENIGYGDSILLALCCITTNLQNGIFIIIISFVYSAIYSLILLLTGKSSKHTIPFVPFIFLGYTSYLLA